MKQGKPVVIGNGLAEIRGPGRSWVILDRAWFCDRSSSAWFAALLAIALPLGPGKLVWVPDAPKPKGKNA